MYRTPQHMMSVLSSRFHRIDHTAQSFTVHTTLFKTNVRTRTRGAFPEAEDEGYGLDLEVELGVLVEVVG